MKDLHGSENNPVALIDEDFETQVFTPVYKVQIYKNGWQDVDGIVSLSVDFQGSAADGVVSASLNLTVNDETAKYHPFSNTPYSDYFGFRRKIRVFIGLKKGESDYTWSYFTGNINSAQHSKSAAGRGLQRTVTVRALDYCDVLNTYKFGKNVYWGLTTSVVLQPNMYEYNMPTECNGIHHVTQDGAEFTDWTYNWETNKLAVTTEELVGTLMVYYYTTQNVVSVLQKILTDVGIAASLAYEPTSRTIQRVYFDEGTSALEAVKRLSQLINYRFWFDGDGIPHFAPVKEVETTTDFAFKDYKNLQVQTATIEDSEFYNAVEVFGEERSRKQYYKKEIQLGSTVESYLDATTESRSHNFSFIGYDKLRYQLDCTNKNGLTAELNESPNGAEVTVTHNPEQSRAETESNLGYATGSLFYGLNGQQIINTSETKFIDHVAATRIRAIISEAGYNKYGMQVSLTPESYWRSQLYLSHDPLRNLSDVVQTIGSKSGVASTAGNLLTVPFTPGKIWGKVKWDADYETGWGEEQQTGYDSTSISSPGTYYKTVYLSPGNQGQIRWEVSGPNNVPDSTTYFLAGRNSDLVGPWQTKTISRSYDTSLHIDPHGTWGVRNSDYVKVIDSVWSGTSYSVTFQNWSQAESFLAWVEIYARRRGITFNVEHSYSTEDRVRFKISAVGHPAYLPATFRFYVYSKRKPYNIKVANTKMTEFNAEFKATCEFGNPPVTITCTGQEPIARPYRIDLVGYELVPRHYFLKLFGREVVSELTSTIYSQKTLTPTEIQETGGKKTLTVHNHLVQSQTEAEEIAQNLLNHYREIVNSFVIEVSCPPPLEVGDTVSIISQT